LQPQPLHADTRQIGIVGVKCGELADDAGFECGPGRLRHGCQSVLQGNANQSQLDRKMLDMVGGKRAVPSKGREIHIVGGAFAQCDQRFIRIGNRKGIELSQPL
jgi:hypothetical protein